MSRFLLIELLALVFPLTLAICPKGAIEGLNPSDCYIFIAAPKNWNDAESDCVSKQGHLASIPDAFHNAFLKQEISSISSSVNETWIGANTMQTPDQWTWSDQTNFTYSNFLQGMTENDTDVCASFDTYTGKWSVESCHDLSLSYICKVNAESGTNSCDAGYVYFPGTKHCYKTIDASGKNFNQTEDECARDGGHLTSIHNEDENTFVLALIYGSNAWIGLYFDGLVGNWTDGTPNDYSNFFASPYIFDKCAYLVGQHGIPDLYRFWVTDDCTKSEGLAVCKKSSA